MGSLVGYARHWMKQRRWLDAFENQKAADDFLDVYDRQVGILSTFPIGYRGISKNIYEI